MRGSAAAVLVFVLNLGLSPLAEAQAKRLTMSGVVTDRQSRIPIQGATVIVIGGKANSATTDSEGSFILNFVAGVIEGETVRVRIEKSGYLVYDRSVAVSSSIPLQVLLERTQPGQFSEPLKIEGLIGVVHDPWFYILPPRVGVTQPNPIPMWLFFYLTVHNKGPRNIWISYYSVSAHTRDRNRWIQLTLPPPDTLFRLYPGPTATLKPQDVFTNNAAASPIQPDGYLSGYLFFGTCIAETVDKLEFEFHDKEENLHRLQVRAFNVIPSQSVIPGQSGTPDQTPDQTFVASVGGGSLHFDNSNAQALDPDVEAWVRRIRPYASLFPDAYGGMRGPLQPCTNWKP